MIVLDHTCELVLLRYVRFGWIRALLAGCLFFALVTSAVAAQDDGTVTPTTAPTKTPLPPTTTPLPTLTATVPATQDRGIIDFRPLTQTDLSILTGNVQRPNGITWHEGNLYVSCTGDWTIYQINTETNRTVAYIYGVRNANTLYAETGTDGELHLWVPDFQTNQLNDITRHGVRPVATELAGPWGLAYLNEESFLVSNLAANTVSRVTRDGEVQTAVSGLRAPTGVEVDGEYVYVANNGSARRAIEWYPLPDFEAGQPVEAAEPEAQRLVGGLQNVTGMELGPDGYLYFAYSLGARGVVGRVEPEPCRENGGCTNADVEIVLLTELAAPLAGLTVTPDRRLYVHTMFSPDIYWADLNGSGGA